MNVAFLFNSDHPSLVGYYGPLVMEHILETGVLQNTDRQMRISVGDILTFMAASTSETPTYDYLQKLCELVYQPVLFDRLDRARVRGTFTTATVYCWLFQNMTQSTAESLHGQLTGCPAYLGAMDVDFSKPLHLSFFRNQLMEVYRLRGLGSKIFYQMGGNDDPDIVITECFEKNGFDVSYEDQGARCTIFDKYDTIDHFVRVEAFKSYFSKLQGLDADYTSNIAHSLEELHPRLFDVLAAAVRTLSRAETEEDLAQAALSGRRFLEKTADYLFPPQSGDWKGRKVGKAQYKNRLWAYIDKTLRASHDPDLSALNLLGKEADRLVDLFNAGLHAEPNRQKLDLAFRDLVVWLTDLINIDPTAAIDSYLAYEQELSNFLTDVVSDDEVEDV